MLPREELVRLFGSAEALAEIDRQSAEEVAKWPPLSPSQKARLRALLAPAAAPAPVIPAPAARAPQSPPRRLAA